MLVAVVCGLKPQPVRSQAQNERGRGPAGLDWELDLGAVTLVRHPKDVAVQDSAFHLL